MSNKVRKSHHHRYTWLRHIFAERELQLHYHHINTDLLEVKMRHLSTCLTHKVWIYASSFRPGIKECQMGITMSCPCSKSFRTVLLPAWRLGSGHSPVCVTGLHMSDKPDTAPLVLENRHPGFQHWRGFITVPYWCIFSGVFTVNINQKWGTSQRIQN